MSIKYEKKGNMSIKAICDKYFGLLKEGEKPFDELSLDEQLVSIDFPDSKRQLTVVEPHREKKHSLPVETEKSILERVDDYLKSQKDPEQAEKEQIEKELSALNNMGFGEFKSDTDDIDIVPETPSDEEMFKGLLEEEHTSRKAFVDNLRKGVNNFLKLAKDL